MKEFEFALDRARNEINEPLNKDIFVTVPDGVVYVNSNPDAIKKHLKDNKLEIVHLKINGVIQNYK